MPIPGPVLCEKPHKLESALLFRFGPQSDGKGDTIMDARAIA